MPTQAQAKSPMTWRDETQVSVGMIGHASNPIGSLAPALWNNEERLLCLLTKAACYSQGGKCLNSNMSNH